MVSLIPTLVVCTAWPEVPRDALLIAHDSKVDMMHWAIAYA